MCAVWHSVWAGTPGVPLARCGCSILNDRGTEAEETSPGVLHHAIPRCHVGLIAPSFCAPYKPPWHLASCIHYVVSQCYFRLWCSCITGGGWYAEARLLASKYDSWGKFLTPLFWTLHARSGVMYCVMLCINISQCRGLHCHLLSSSESLRETKAAAVNIITCIHFWLDSWWVGSAYGIQSRLSYVSVRSCIWEWRAKQES